MPTRGVHRPLHYTWWALQALFELGWLARDARIDPFTYVSASGGSIQQALEWVLPYATGAAPFPSPELTPFDHGKFFKILAF